MGNYINKYANEAAYLADVTKQYPNVSYIVSGETILYVKENPTNGLTVHYNVIDTENEIPLFNGGGESSSSSESGGGGVLPSKMFVDGVEETVISTWRFTTTGEHTVRFLFEDNTIPSNFINGNISAAYKVEVGGDITELGDYAFSESVITAATISQSVWSFGDYAFQYCLSLASVTIYATTPPSLGYSVFDSNASGRKIYVPSASLSSYQELWADYASDIEAIQ